MATALVWHELMMWFDTGAFAGPMRALFPVQPGEPSENPEAKRRIKNLLDASGYIEQFAVITPPPATQQAVLRVHTPRLLQEVKTLSAGFGGQLGISAFTGSGGYEIALLAAGGTCAATDAVLTGRATNAYALVRPPGHHATADGGVGFCVFNNIAIAARHAQTKHGVSRIAVVDWDVHHGNGTQSIFYDDPSVLTISLHQDGNFPRINDAIHGAVAEQGEGKARGTAVNIPLPPGCGTAAYRAAFERIVMPALYAFQPELIFVACGLDAGNNDALGRMMLGPEDFRWMTAEVMQAAADLCAGHLVLSHEGGYHAPSAPFLALPIFEQLSGVPSGIANPMATRMSGLPPSKLHAHEDAAIELARNAALVLQKART
jgi:acetoin utilization deacetylase AcuC-like enzyme